jgi:transcription elongation factor GreA
MTPPAMQKNPITPEGHARLREELQNLRAVERPAIIQAIAVAREHGDLSENAEYHAARDKQSFIEGRIKEIENKLALAEVIDPSKVAGSRVAFGATVKLSNSDTGEEVSYRILGADEADLAQGTISVTSPLARSLLGKEAGDEVKVRMPGGDRTYEVLDVSFR